jgi:hypothetical protein
MDNQGSQEFVAALGTAVVAIWGRLPADVQHNLFEEAVRSAGKGARERLAVFLHDRHPRTSAVADSAEPAPQVPTPDSLGG